MSVGIDIIAHHRLRGQQKLADKILSPTEKAIFLNLTEKQQTFFLAGRWAIKEAMIKCDNALIMNQITITNDASGAPRCSDPRFSISLANEAEYSVAVAFLLTN